MTTHGFYHAPPGTRAIPEPAVEIVPDPLTELIIENNLSYLRGCAVRVILEAGKYDPTTTLQDLRKAQWHIEREIQRLSDNAARI